MHHQSIVSRIDGQSPSREFHQFHFRGTWCPPRVYQALGNGQIIGKDWNLLSMIDSLTDPDGRGCYATNTYFATQLGISARAVRYALQRLTGAGLVVSNGHTRHRELRTSWAAQTDNQPINNGRLGKRRFPSIREAPLPTEGIPTVFPDSKEEADAATRRAATPGSCRTNPTNTVKKGGSMPIPSMNKSCPQSANSKPPKPRIEEVDRSRSKRLKEHVRRMGWFVSASHRKWERAFARLRRRLESCATQHTTIDAALNFLIGRGDVKPRIRNGQELADCWEWVWGLMESDRNPCRPEDISPQGREIVKRLTDTFIWPKGSESQLPVVVQRSLDAFDHFRNRLRKIKANPSADRAVLGLADRVLAYTGHPEDFVYDWMRSLHKRLCHWRDWSGNNMAAFAFGPDATEFTADGRGWAEEYSDDPDLWGTLMKEVGR